MLEYQPKNGEDFSVIIKNMIALANQSNEEVEIIFKGVPITVRRGDTLKTVERFFSTELIRRRERLQNSPDYGEKEREMDRCRDRMADAALRLERIRKSKLKRSLSLASKKMNFLNNDNEQWRKIVAMKSDGCGGRLIRFVERWARLMEGWLKVHGGTIEGCANITFHLANTENLPESKHGEAVLMLSKARWIYGPELDHHLNKPPIKNEGKKKKENHYSLLRPILR